MYTYVCIHDVYVICIYVSGQMDPIEKCPEKCPVHPTYHSYSQMGLPERVAPSNSHDSSSLKNAHK